MDWGRLTDILRARARALFRRRAADGEARDELAFHLAMQTRANIRSGMAPADAERAARRDLGNSTRISEDLHDLTTLPFVETLWHDLRFGVRLLRKNPSFAVVSVLTLALGTGANAAIFELMNALQFRSLPVSSPNELVSLRIDQHGKGRVGMGLPGGLFTVPLFREIAARQQAFSSLVAWTIDRWNLSTGGDVVWAQGQYVSGSYFTGLGVPAAVGRVFTSDDDRDGCSAPAAVLSHSFWRSRYGGDPAVVGRTMSLDGHALTIAGVSADGFSGLNVGRVFDVALPMCAEPLLRGRLTLSTRRDAWWLDVMGRLNPGWTIERAHTHVAAISPAVFGATIPASYKPEWARNYAAFTLTAAPAATGSISVLRLRFSAQLWALFGVTAFVLVLTCANLANLMLARSTARSHEIAVRLAIGASRRRIIRQLLAESAIIAVVGTLVGALLARWMSLWLVAFLSSATNPIFLDLSPDWKAFAFIATVAAATCLAFGLSPALTSTRRDLAASMQAGGGRASDGHEANVLRRGLVVAQIALSIALVIGALLFARTLRNLGSVNLGYEPHVTSVAVDLRRTGVAPAARAKAFGDIRTELQQTPGVQQAGEAMIIPLSGGDWNGAILRDGVVQKGDAHFNEVGGGYFRTMQIPLVAGRTFDGRDRIGTPKVVVVSQTFVRRFFPDSDPIGRTFQLDVPPPQPTYTIVGVVGDTKIRQIRDERTGAAVSFTGDYATTFLPIAYLSVSQDDSPPPELRFVLRSDAPAASMSRVLTQKITSTVPGATVSYENVMTFVDDALMSERLMAWLSAFFGVLAVLIAVVGLYGVMSYLVSRRRFEIGVRMVLGAQTAAVMRLVLGDSVKLLLAGVVCGLAVAMLIARYAAALLFGLKPIDPVSFAVGTLVLALGSLVACYVPARRATRIDPATTLREV
ncbi:MAG TPA: ABC transporter permease [Vicinamibacterales bacterium]|nr:ABC transporter permease [Vicinamibacterales bacterium]